MNNIIIILAIILIMHIGYTKARYLKTRTFDELDNLDEYFNNDDEYKVSRMIEENLNDAGNTEYIAGRCQKIYDCRQICYTTCKDVCVYVGENCNSV